MPGPPNRSDRRLHVLVVLLIAALVAPLASSALAQDSTTQDSEDAPAVEEEETQTVPGVSDDDLILGSQVYSRICSACHQPGGVGIAGQFPPLLGNPNVQDSEYLADTIRNGREGEIEVLGEVYDGRMPAFSTLPDDEVSALIAYVQSGFVVPAAAPAAPGTETTDRGLPALTDFTALVAYLIAGGVALLVLAPRITSANDRLQTPWLDAWLKSGLIVIGFIVFTVFVPDWAMQTETVSKLDRRVQDLVGTGLWVGGLAAGLWALWYAHREDRV